MNKIIPFKKNIDFESIFEIKSISLEHKLSIKDDNLIKGKFIISGTYKMTEASINIDEFNFDLPFEINIDKKYDVTGVNVDINDFYYEVIDNKSLDLNIEIIIENLNEKEEKMTLDVRDADNIEKLEFENNIISEEQLKDSFNEENIKEEEENERPVMTTIFDDLDCNENYVTYKIHIMSENDTVESVLKKYNIKSSKLEDYNNLDDIKIGDKLIIPTND